MKRLLIISPYFPPSNAADMQRIRMSLPYFKDFGWEAEVVTVDEKYSEMVKDGLLSQSIPNDVVIHQAKALSKKWTSKFGLGSLALRSMYFYRQKVNLLLREKHFDLIYFSTTQFPVCILGAYWKKKFGVPYVIDMQDPWHSDYYQDKPKKERPPKYWFSYRLNKYLEPLAMKRVDGLISVSEAYIQTLKERYPAISTIPAEVIPFGACEKDFEIAAKQKSQLQLGFVKDPAFFHVVYIGRGGHDMSKSVKILFNALAEGLKNEPALFSKLRFHFIGTSYAPAGQGVPTIRPIAAEMQVEQSVNEHTDRMGFYDSLATLQQADALFIPGSDHASYTASKIYSYLLIEKPLVGLFHEQSSAIQIIKTCSPDTTLITFNEEDTLDYANNLENLLRQWATGKAKPCLIDQARFKSYMAEKMTLKQVELFNQLIA